MGIIGKCFEACYDFVAKGGLKKTVVALFAISLIMLTTAYLVYPQTTTSVALSVAGASTGEFEPPEISGEDNVEYVGSFSGSAGPVGTGVSGELYVDVNFETGEATAHAEGDKVKNGYIEGTVDLKDGTTEGTGNVNAFGLTGVPFEYEGRFSEDGTRAEGTWEGTGELSGSGTWEMERVDETELNESALGDSPE